MKCFLRRLFSRYDYGVLDHPDGATARRHRISGKLEFQLWEKGHFRAPHNAGCWLNAGDGHIFIPLSKLSADKARMFA